MWSISICFRVNGHTSFHPKREEGQRQGQGWERSSSARTNLIRVEFASCRVPNRVVNNNGWDRRTGRWAQGLHTIDDKLPESWVGRSVATCADKGWEQRAMLALLPQITTMVYVRKRRCQRRYLHVTYSKC